MSEYGAPLQLQDLQPPSERDLMMKGFCFMPADSLTCSPKPNSAVSANDPIRVPPVPPDCQEWRTLQRDPPELICVLLSFSLKKRFSLTDLPLQMRGTWTSAVPTWM